MPDKLVDDNGKPLPFVALNGAKGGGTAARYADRSFPVPSALMSEFKNGANCGRWVEIVIGDNCVGGPNSNDNVCIGGSYVSDQFSGTTIYGYVSDSCLDKNYWCRDDLDHLDLSGPFLESTGMKAGWNGRKLEWRYLDSVPPGYSMSGGLKFAFKSDSKWQANGAFWLSLILWNLPNGVGGVEQDLGGGTWVETDTLAQLGQQWVLKPPQNYSGPKVVRVRVRDVDGKAYGVYDIDFPCGGAPCSDDTDAEFEII